MRRILVAGCEQEISSFNPHTSRYEDFAIHRGDEVFAAHREADSCIRGFMNRFATREDIELVPVFAASACSAGPLLEADFQKLLAEMLQSMRDAASDADAVYVSLHGAMGATGELDPEGAILEGIRGIVGPAVPIVISLDLHGLLTARMLANCDAIAVYHTYPHNDFTSTGERAGRLMARILDDGARPVMARVFLPALVRGPELVTATGKYGRIIDRAKAMETSGDALSAAMMIGNPFTDAPELGAQSLVVTDNAPEQAQRLALELADAFWADHDHMLASLDDPKDAIADVAASGGPVTFTDAADAPSSGASGDSNAILRHLIAAEFQGSALIPIVDAPASRRAHDVGVGGRFCATLGGTIDPARFPPLNLDVEVEQLGDGEFRHEFSRMPAHAGPTAVLRHGGLRIIVLSKSVFLMDRAVFLSHGLTPEQADIAVVKSPGAALRYFTYARRNFVLDVPGSTSANLPSLGHKVCRRPMFPLDEDVTFVPETDLYPTELRP